MAKSPTSTATSIQPLRTRTWLLFSAWIPVLIGMVVIFLESSDYLSSANTGSFLTRLMNFIWKHGSPVRLEALNYLLRKSGHFLGYGILALLFFRAIRHSVSLKAISRGIETSRQRVFRWACEAAFCTAAIAAIDEWHQTLLPSRTGAFHDVVLDTTGAVVLLMLVLIRYAIRPIVTEAK